jgi:hypothetical protein
VSTSPSNFREPGKLRAIKEGGTAAEFDRPNRLSKEGLRSLEPSHLESIMSVQRVVGILLLVLGVGLFIVGVNASDSIADRWTNFFTGHFTDTTVWYMVGGIALAIVGLIVAFGSRMTSR